MRMISPGDVVVCTVNTECPGVYLRPRIVRSIISRDEDYVTLAGCDGWEFRKDIFMPLTEFIGLADGLPWLVYELGVTPVENEVKCSCSVGDLVAFGCPSASGGDCPS